MEIRRLEKTLYYDGIAFLRYRLEYPASAEGEFPDFARAMTESYRDYIETDLLEGLCSLYDADPTRRKRFRHEIVQVVQRAFWRETDDCLSVYFTICENGNECQFGWTFDKARGIVMTLGDFGLKRAGMKKTTLFYRDTCRFITFGKDGRILKKIEKKAEKNEKTS